MPSPQFSASVAVLLGLVEALTLSPVAALASDRVTSVSPGDVDADTIPDSIERVVCGNATCATGTEDVDGDGIADAIEVASCGTTRCADPRADADGDGIPDFVERLVCGSDTCTSGREDTDGDGVPDWVEFVICGSATCATGSEDLDGDGVADAASLQAYALYRQKLATTGQGRDGVPWAVGVGAALILCGAGALVVRMRRRARHDANEGAEVLP